MQFEKHVIAGPSQPSRVAGSLYSASLSHCRYLCIFIYDYQVYLLRTLDPTCSKASTPKKVELKIVQIIAYTNKNKNSTFLLFTVWKLTVSVFLSK